jgi:CheY-like chemotaxis protein
VSLPVTREVPAAAIPAASRAAPKGLRILIVDDEVALQELLMEAFTGAGNRVETAVDGRQALEILSGSTFDVLVLDVRMPGMSGIELWSEIHRRNAALARRTVFCTGSVVSEKTRASLEATGCPTVAKPFNLEVLLDAVARVHSDKEARHYANGA